MGGADFGDLLDPGDDGTDRDPARAALSGALTLLTRLAEGPTPQASAALAAFLAGAPAAAAAPPPRRRSLRRAAPGAGLLVVLAQLGFGAKCALAAAGVAATVAVTTQTALVHHERPSSVAPVSPPSGGQRPGDPSVPGDPTDGPGFLLPGSAAEGASGDSPGSGPALQPPSGARGDDRDDGTRDHGGGPGSDRTGSEDSPTGSDEGGDHSDGDVDDDAPADGDPGKSDRDQDSRADEDPGSERSGSDRNSSSDNSSSDKDSDAAHDPGDDPDSSDPEPGSDD